MSYLIIGLFLSSVLTTGIGTSLIILRILSTTRRNPSINVAPYQRIQRIILQSGVIYIIGVLILGTPLAVARYIVIGPPARSGTPLFLPCAVIVTYGEALLTPFTVSFPPINHSHFTNSFGRVLLPF